MKKYIITYHAPEHILKRETEDPEDNEGGDINAWEAWAKESGDALVEFGSPAATGFRLNHEGSLDPSESDLCGYSIIQAENPEKAAEIMKNNPHMNWDPMCFVEIHEILPI